MSAACLPSLGSPESCTCLVVWTRHRSQSIKSRHGLGSLSSGLNNGLVTRYGSLFLGTRRGRVSALARCVMRSLSRTRLGPALQSPLFSMFIGLLPTQLRMRSLLSSLSRFTAGRASGAETPSAFSLVPLWPKSHRGCCVFLHASRWLRSQFGFVRCVSLCCSLHQNEQQKSRVVFVASAHFNDRSN